MLNIDNVSAGYGDLQALYNISIKLEKGEVVSLVGSNGAGKTTLLRVISGFVPVRSGSITYEGANLLNQPSFMRADLGIAHIPQGRGILGKLSVKENLIIGAYTKRANANIKINMEKSFEMFPKLLRLQNQMAGCLSGGEQQMLAIARALMMEPKLILMDEPSLGLAPIIVKEVFSIITKVANQGMSILLVEQNLVEALSVATRGYVLETGRLVMEGRANELLNEPMVRAAYLGI